MRTVKRIGVGSSISSFEREKLYARRRRRLDSWMTSPINESVVRLSNRRAIWLESIANTLSAYFDYLLLRFVCFTSRRTVYFISELCPIVPYGLLLYFLKLVWLFD